MGRSSIALGETLPIAEERAAELDWTPAIQVAAAVSVVASLAMWRPCFDVGSRRGPRACDEQHPGRLARVACAYLHRPIGGGLVLMAVGDEGPVDHPHGPVGWKDGVMILGGRCCSWATPVPERHKPPLGGEPPDRPRASALPMFLAQRFDASGLTA